MPYISDPGAGQVAPTISAPAPVPASSLPPTHPLAQSNPLSTPNLNYDTGPLTGQPVADLLQQGNIDVNHRPNIKNADGSSSSIYSMTVPLGADSSPLPWGHPKITKYALVPSIVNGKFLTPNGQMPVEGDTKANQQLEDEATKYYAKTRQHLGIFKSSEAAGRYAGETHDYGNDGTSRKVYTPSVKRK